jgi:hypothetical protein
MGRLKKTVAGERMTFVVDSDLAAAVRATVASTQGMTLSGFGQAALANYLRGHRPVMEYVNEQRHKKQRSNVATGLDLKLDRADGCPLHAVSDWSEAHWREEWTAWSGMRGLVDDLRSDAGRDAISDTEWKAVVRYMGSEPGE